LIAQSATYGYGEKLICHYGTQQPNHMTSDTCGIICFAFIFFFCKSFEMMGSDKIHTASHTYVHVLSLAMSSLPFTGYLKSHKCELPKDTFLVQFFSQLYTYEKWIKIPLLFITTVFHRALASFLLQQKDRVALQCRKTSSSMVSSGKRLVD
jgi:hypothetical protein